MDIYSNGKTSSRAQINSRTNRLLSVRAYNSGHLAVVVYYCYFFIFLFFFLFFFFYIYTFFCFLLLFPELSPKVFWMIYYLTIWTATFQTRPADAQIITYSLSLRRNSVCGRKFVYFGTSPKKYEQKCSPWLAENNLRSLNQDV